MSDVYMRFSEGEYEGRPCVCTAYGSLMEALSTPPGTPGDTVVCGPRVVARASEDHTSWVLITTEYLPSSKGETP